MKKRKESFRNKLKNLMGQPINYMLEMEHNVFRTYQLAQFGLLLTFGGVFLILISRTISPEQWKWYWRLLGVYFIPPAGKETVIPLGINRGIPSFTWFISIVIIDILVSITIITNWWIIELGISKSKWINKWYTSLQNKVRKMKTKKYGVLLPLLLLIFMFIPFQGSGTMSTTILGTLLGINTKHIIIIVIIGAILSALFVTIVYCEGSLLV